MESSLSKHQSEKEFKQMVEIRENEEGDVLRCNERCLLQVIIDGLEWDGNAMPNGMRAFLMTKGDDCSTGGAHEQNPPQLNEHAVRPRFRANRCSRNVAQH